MRRAYTVTKVTVKWEEMCGEVPASVKGVAPQIEALECRRARCLRSEGHMANVRSILKQRRSLKYQRDITAVQSKPRKLNFWFYRSVKHDKQVFHVSFLLRIYMA